MNDKMKMTREQTWLAMRNLTNFNLNMLPDGTWYVHHPYVEIKSSSFLFLKSPSGNGDTPYDALENHWRQLTELASDEYIVLYAMNGMRVNRRAVRWNGFMWEDVNE